jgi:putative oxidoreductase
MERAAPYLILIGRVLLSIIFIQAGWSKIFGYAGTAEHMQAAGVPGALLPLVILTELGGGLCVLLGLFTRWAAIALAGFCVLAAYLFHYQPGDMMQMINFVKNSRCRRLPRSRGLRPGATRRQSPRLVH